MIVNPQFFNYRIIIGSLLVGMTALAIVSFNSYESSQAEQRFLNQEKKLVESELSQMLLSYDHLSTENELISNQLDSAQITTQSALEQLRLMKSDVSVLSRIKSELSSIRSKNSSLLKTIDSINRQNDRLEHERLLVYAKLNEQHDVHKAPISPHTSLPNTLEKEPLLTATTITAKAYRSGLNRGATTKARQTDRIEVCFSLAENTLVDKGMKDIYIQILNPLNNVIADKGAATFGKFLLFYSDKQSINYNNQVLDACTTVKAKENDKPFEKGTYYVSVFHKEHKLGSTQIELN